MARILTHATPALWVATFPKPITIDGVGDREQSSFEGSRVLMTLPPCLASCPIFSMSTVLAVDLDRTFTMSLSSSKLA